LLSAFASIYIVVATAAILSLPPNRNLMSGYKKKKIPTRRANIAGKNKSCLTRSPQNNKQSMPKYTNKDVLIFLSRK